MDDRTPSQRTPHERSTPSSRVLGPYELLGELGRGGMGVVYRARDCRPPSAPGTPGAPREVREVALKVLLHGVDSNPARVERFRREAVITAALEHPGIVRALNAGITGGRPWVAFELVDGAQTFQEVFKTAPVRRRAELIRDAARALGFAHQRGIVHRDVKPANLLVDRAGRVRVTDFGLAAARGLAPLTQTGSLMGTPLWMSPEQAGAERELLGPPSDVWGLGVILYEALTGTLPFDSPSFVDLVSSITRAAPRPPHAVAKGVDPALEAVCLRALHRDPARRYPHGDAMADDLERALASPGAQATRPSGARQVAVRPAPRLPLVVVHLSLAAAGLAAIVGLLVLRKRPPPPAPPPPPVVVTPPAPPPITPTIVDASPEAARLRALQHGAQRGDRDSLYALGRAHLTGQGVARAPAAAMVWLLQAAALGHGSAANDVGGLWNEGHGVPRDERRAREWFKRAADLDDPAGMTNLGACMSMGVGGPRDPAQAVILFRAAAARGSHEATFRMGLAFERGDGVDVSRAEAAAWYRRAAEAGHPMSMVALAKLLEAEAVRRPEAREEATSWLRRAAELGDERARQRLADAGETPTDADAPVATLRAAADQGDANAAAELGLAYLEGKRGLGKDVAQAEAWLRRAVDGGALRVIVALAELLQGVTGERAVAARREAVLLLQRGVEAGDVGAMTNLGHIYASAEGAARDDVQAAALFRRAAEAGEAGSMRNLGVFLRDGRGGLARDPAQALTWLRRAADAGRPDAMVLLADQLAKGVGCEPAPAEAQRWLRLAADKGDPEGMLLLAQLLLDGPQGGRAEGSRLLHTAAQRNHPRAMVELARRIAKGRGFTRRVTPAISFAQRAATLGSGEGLLFMARLLDDLGREAQARALLQPLADAGLPHAMFQLARLLEHGRGGPADAALAASLRQRAADAGLVEAIAAQAAGRAPTEPAAALALWRRAADAGHTGSMLELWRRLGATDRADARAWLERAAAAGDAEARLRLAAGP
jgi:TPR repeat protein